jgi:hypothetical protein
MSNELTNQDLIDIVEDSLPDDRRELVRQVLKENPDLARRLKALHEDRARLRAIAQQDAQTGPPSGLVAAAIDASRSAGGGLKLVHADDAPLDDRSRHHRPALTRSRWPVTIAASVTLLVLGGVSFFIIQTTSPEANRDRVLAEIERKENIRLAPGEGSTPEVAINQGIASMEEDLAKQRALDNQIDRLAEGRDGSSKITEGDGNIDLGDLDFNLDQLLAEGLNVEDVLEESGLSVDELGVALLEGRVVVTARGQSGERILTAAAKLDGAQSGAGRAVAVRGLKGLVIDGQRVDLAKPAPEPAQGDPAPLAQGPIGEVEVAFATISDRSIGGAYAEFKTLLAAIAQVSGDVVIWIDADAAPRRSAPLLEVDSAGWWEQGKEAWVVPMPASFRLVVEPPVEGPAEGG